ncbi:MAG: hypothetical protein CMJ85_13695 [Planctomycetes bacterium]|jgi:hypothetical protein|nr:hypothetical protein [Planctomycetota bacterium]
MRALFLPVLLLPLALGFPQTQSNKQRLRHTIEDKAPSSRWIWNDFARARKQAKKSGKPIFALFRCVP